MKRVVLFNILFLLMLGGLYAQEPRQWTLQECVDVALEKNLRVKRSLYNVESSKITLLQSKMAFLPTLNAGTAYGQNFGRALNPVTNLYANRNSNTINVQANSALTLFNGLRLQNTFRQSAVDYDASNEDFSKAKNDVIINVVTLYTNVIFNKELFGNTKYQLSSSQQQLERIKKQVIAGSLPKSNELNQEAQVATNEVNLINQENSLNLSMLQLKQSMQLPGSTPFDVAIPELETEDLILEQTPEEIYDISLQTMPEIKSAILRVQSAQLGLKASKGNLYPRFTVNANATSNYSSVSDQARYAFDSDNPPSISSSPIGITQPGNEQVYSYVPATKKIADGYDERDQLKDNVFKSFSFQLSIPVFNGLQTRSAVQRAAITNELAQISKQETENTLRQTIESAYNDAFSAAKTYAASLKQVNAREEAYRMNKQRFDLGALSYVEYQISENDLFQAKSDLTRAKYNFIFKKKVLDFYQGKTISY
ncbi:MAG: TolC family protein [Bacteroidota bacterium]